MASVKKCAKKILANEWRLDYLVNNAGVAMCPYEKTVDGFELQFATNHLGHFLLTELLLPLIKTTGSSGAKSRFHNVATNSKKIKCDKY